MRHLVSLPEAGTRRTWARTTRILTWQGIARRGRTAQSPFGSIIARRGHRAAVAEVIEAAADRVPRVGHAAGHGLLRVEGDQDLEIVDDAVRGHEAGREALPQLLRSQMVRLLSPARRKEPRPMRRSPSFRATRSAGIAVLMVTSAKRHIAR